MTDTTTPTAPAAPVKPAGPLNDEQKARVIALEAAQKVLIGTPGMFGGTANARPYTDIIEVAEYIIGGKPAPEVAEPGTAWIDVTPDISGFMADIKEASKQARLEECNNPECWCNQAAPAEQAEPDATQAEPADPAPAVADILADAPLSRSAYRARRAAEKAAR